MPAPTPDAILDNPPPLVPSNLQNFPYVVTAFPATDVAEDLTIGNPAANGKGDANQPDDRLE